MQKGLCNTELENICKYFTGQIYLYQGINTAENI